MAMQPWQDPGSPVAGWQLAQARFGGGEGSMQQFRWNRAEAGDASQDSGLAAELHRQRVRQEQRVARAVEIDGIIDRQGDLALNPIAGGGIGGRDRVEMSHIVSQDVPAAPQMAPARPPSRKPRRFPCLCKCLPLCRLTLLALVGPTGVLLVVPMDAVEAMVAAILAVAVAAIIRSVQLHVRRILEESGPPPTSPIPISVEDPQPLKPSA